MKLLLTIIFILALWSSCKCVIKNINITLGRNEEKEVGLAGIFLILAIILWGVYHYLSITY